MITEILKSKAVEGVLPRGATATKKPSVITMAIDHRFAAEAYGYFEDKKEGKIPETGLIGFKLLALYEDGQTEEVIDVELDYDVAAPSDDFIPEPADTAGEADEDTIEEMELEEELSDGE